MPLQARRVFRIAFTVALSLAVAYGMAFPLPFIAPIFALMLSAQPGPPMGPKSIIGLILVVLVTLGGGLLLVPFLKHYPLAGVLLVGIGIYFSIYVTVTLGKALVGTFMTIGYTMIPIAGTASTGLATAVIWALVLGIGVAVACQWLVYPCFPEDKLPARPAGDPAGGAQRSNWLALRAVFVVLPAFLLALTNPSLYLPVVMKSLQLGQQGSIGDAHHAGRELLGSTFLGGCLAVVFWCLLGMAPNLWMFFLWTLLFYVFFAGKLYRAFATRLPAAFWQNVAVTLLILLGSAVQDSENGKDVYSAFAVRMSLFVAVTVYAWLAIVLLEHLRMRRNRRLRASAPAMGVG